MLKFFTTILNLIKAFFGLIFMIINHIIQFVLNIPTYLNFISSLFHFVPEFATPFVVAALAYFVVELVYKKVRGIQ